MPAESDLVWQGISMRRMEHQYGTTWQGFWGSPHEEWAYLFLPYFDLPEYRQLFRIREKIRSRNVAVTEFCRSGDNSIRPGREGEKEDAAAHTAHFLSEKEGTEAPSSLSYSALSFWP